MKKVPAPQVATAKEAMKGDLPGAVQEALGDLAGAAREGLLALSVGVGLGVVHELMEAEVTEVCGPKGKNDPDRKATRHGHEDGKVTLGGRRATVSRPRMRSVLEDRELGLATYEHFGERDPLSDLVFERIVSGVSCRGYARTNEPVGEEVEERSSATSKSAISRAFVERTATALEELMSRCLEDVRLAAMMIDGVEIGGRTHVVALGITTQGAKVPLGLWEGSTENTTVATNLLSDLVDRGLDPEQGILFAIDGAKALAKAIRDVFGERAPVQRCQRHKERNVLDHLGENEQSTVRSRLRSAWALAGHEEALASLRALAAELERTHPDAAKSLREGLEETVTLQRLGASEQLRKTLGSTNPIESMIGVVRRIQRNVKSWQDGDMRKRWTAAGMLEAERQFRRIIGYADLGDLAVAVEREVAAASLPSPTREEETKIVTV
jgi:transposase-like protein